MSEKNYLLSLSKEDWALRNKAVTLYMLLGNMRLVSEKTGVFLDTLYDWKKTDWWAELIEEARASEKKKRLSTVDEVVKMSLEVTKDRLENGDFVLNQKTGEIVRKPVGLRDAATITNNLLARQIQMEEMAEKMQHHKSSTQEVLNLLAKEFKKFNRIQNTNATTIEFKDVNNAVYDQREAGLQEGGGEVHIQTSSQEEAR